MHEPLLKIVAIGPESTGKSSLCASLAAHYGAHWCPEYAREYLTVNGNAYTYDDLLAIARGQLEREDAAARQAEADLLARKAPPLLFIDTDMQVMRVWCEFVFGRCHRFILDGIVERRYDLYLLCHTDLPWQRDALREYPDLQTRDRLFRMYREILVNQEVPWAPVTGTGPERLEMAMNAVDGLLKARQLGVAAPSMAG